MRLIKPAITLFLKTSTGCNAGCKSCPAGRKETKERELSGKMTIDMFTRILDRIQPQANIVSVVLHYYNEPTLNHENISQMVALARKRNIPTLMSTNGSYPDKLKSILDAGLDNLIFSLSGWTNEIHQRSHKHVDVEIVKENMRMTASYKQDRTFVRVGWHDYTYNRHEQAQMRAFTESLGFTFTPYATSLLDVQRAHEQLLRVRNGSPFDDPAEEDLLFKMREADHLVRERSHFRCIYQDTMILVDGTGHLWNCPAKVQEHNKRENLFDVCLIEWMKKRRTTEEDCIKCKKDGMHVYAMQQWKRPLTLGATLFRKGEDLYRNLGLGGLFPAITRVYVNALYKRPTDNVPPVD